MISPFGALWASIEQIYVRRRQLPSSATDLVPVVGRRPMAQPTGNIAYRLAGTGRQVPVDGLYPWGLGQPRPALQGALWSAGEAVGQPVPAQSLTATSAAFPWITQL